MMIDRENALTRLRGGDFLQLGMDADDVRQGLWPESVVTYTVGFPVAVGAGVRVDEVEAAVARGATGLVLSAVSGTEALKDLENLRARFPELCLTGFSPAEVLRLGLGFDALKAAGLSLFGNSAGDSGVVDDAWIAVHRAAHQAGLPSVAVLMLRSSDSDEAWVSMLERVAALQAESLQEGTPGFLAVEPRIEHMERALDEVTGARYLKMVALCRLVLETVPHVQVDWGIFGPKVLQVALRFGADDAGLVVASERDRRVPSHHSGEEELRRIIRDAGFMPSQRDGVYARQFVY